MSRTLTVRAAWLSDVGRAREQNEDAAYAGVHVFAVADGLGGHRAGEVASVLALESITALDRHDARKAAAGIGDAVRAANRVVFERAHHDEQLKGMGTTMTAVVIDGSEAHLAHVGDSRCYLIRSDRISQLSTDHTLVARMVAEGKLTQQEAETHPQRSILTRALGADRDVEVEEAEFEMAGGDRLVLCSDGLTAMLADEEIRAIAEPGSDLDAICRALIDEANARGGYDNVTAVVIDVAGDPGTGAGDSGLPGRVAEHRAPERRRLRARPFVWAALVLAVALGGLFGVRAWTNRSFYVGISANTVSIYRGLPVEFGGIRLSHVQEPTTVRASDVPDWLRKRLGEGIRARSLADARRIVATQIEPNATPAPAASPSPRSSPATKGSP